MVAPALSSPRSVRKGAAANLSDLLGSSMASLRSMTDPKIATERLQDSIQSLLSIDSTDDDESVEGIGILEYSSSSGFVEGHTSSKFSMNEIQEMDVRHVDLIRTSWERAKAKETCQTNIGENIIDQMIMLDGSAEAAMGISSTFPTRKDMLGSTVVESLDRIIFQAMGTTLDERELDSTAQEWLDEGLDAKLVHRALVQCLEKVLDKETYTEEASGAWNTTFRDILHKMAFIF